MENFIVSNNIKRKVLIVEDEFVNREILSNILINDYEVDLACDGQEAWEKLQGGAVTYSLILLDLIMPVLNGFELLEKINGDSRLKMIPVIVMTSEKDAEVKSIKQGAADFITKPYDMPTVILARCERIIKLSEDSKIIRSTEKDELTGLYSRGYFFEYIRQIDSCNNGLSMDALVFDIDHFHLINEMYGRKTGNDIIVKVADAIRKTFRGRTGIASRPEADTFYVYCAHEDDNNESIKAIQSVINDEFEALKIRIRAGLYQNADMDIGPEGRFDRAKQACDRIKEDYTASISYYDRDFHMRSIYNEKLIKDVDSALLNGDLKVYFQPKYNITEDVPRLCSAEALIRWNHPENGMISPGVFIPLFENNGLIQRIDNYVWDKAASYIKSWKDKYGFSVPVSVNVSRIDIFDPFLEKKLAKVLEDNGITENDMLLEITESAYAGNSSKVMEVTEKLREVGFKIEMDDFGSGYSSLNMIATIPIDVLKLDMKFVRNMERDEKSLRLVEIVLGIAKFLGVPVVAEGVETEYQFKTLKDMGCQIIQGYYFSKPVPAEEFEMFIQKEVQVK